MACIKPLSEAVRSSVRSGIILYDLARVVEELVYNSLDAGAKKVSVFVGVGTCYIKVVDDGSGITRDGLVLLGERYVTSKLKYLADMDTMTGSFGFRGEALGSISDVSVLEILTKVQGMPNGFRKVLKGCKCLYLGVYDDWQDVGTTVVVRDLFYNQPVRRKQMQSSPKKVLHSVRKCVLYIALVHSNVLFKLIDIDSEEKLLCTQPSSSPLPLLTSSFGTETSRTLHELKLSDGVLEISGYVSGPYNTVALKALQCVYINSRYVCTCPIHKLLNQLATRFNCLDSSKDNSLNSNGKRSRFQAYPNFILNISCPRSRYDLCFEPSKTSVEFKDWLPLLAFIERVITRFWNEKIAEGSISSHAADLSHEEQMWKSNGKIASLEEDLLLELKSAKKVHNMKNLKDSHAHPSSSMDMLAEDGGYLLDKKDCRVSFQKFHSPVFQRQQKETLFDHDMEYPLKSWDHSLAKCTATGKWECESSGWTPYKKLRSSKEHFLDYNQRATQRYNDDIKDCSFGSKWEEDFAKGNLNMCRGSTTTAFSYKCFEFTNNADESSKEFRKPFLKSCSLRESLPPIEAFSAREENFGCQDRTIRTKLKQYDPDDWVGAVRVDGAKPSVGINPETMWQEVALSDQASPKYGSNSNLCIDVNFFSRKGLKSFSFDKDCFIEDEAFSNLGADITNYHASHHYLKSEGHPLNSDPIFESTYWNGGHFSNETALQCDSKFGRASSSGDFLDKDGNNCMSIYDPFLNDFSKGNFLSSNCIRDDPDFNRCSGGKRDFWEFPRGHMSDDILSPGCSLLTEELDWFCLNSSKKIFSNNCPVSSHCFPTYRHSAKDEIQRNPLSHQGCGQTPHYKSRSRSQSAPPFYKGKRIFGAKSHFSIGPEKEEGETLLEGSTFPGTIEEENTQQCSGAWHTYSKANPEKDLYVKPSSHHAHAFRLDIKTIPDIKPGKKDILKGGNSKNSALHVTGSFEEQTDSRIKWRKDCLQVGDRDKSRNVQKQWNILDISSGILQFVSDLLVPDINKKWLEDTKVLQQVDKKFIPVVASGTLVIIDQHAADERIRLEELRHKVLSGEEKTITYLDTEQELVLPEIGHQLLQNYAEQIQYWGWISNIHAHGLKSFTKNMDILQRRPAVVTLVAVPCILGVNLSDVDLLEFLQQLADTDGSSTVPPSVLRVLNSKACRGAIMFGDSLLPSECSLIVEELKQTSLCFQCAHGRPTTVPLVNLEALHRQINKLGVCDDGLNESWHGLSRHKISLKRASKRLNSAMF